MAETGWFSRFAQWLNRTYEERIKAASEVYEYGTSHGHDHAHPTPVVSSPTEDEDDEAAEIVNLPRGTRFR